MNTTRNTHFTALSAAAFLTLAMLLGINALAHVDSPAPQWAQAASTNA